MMIHAALVAILALAPADDQPAAKKDGDLARLQGTWIGKADPTGEGIAVEIEFRDGSIAMALTRNDKTMIGRGTFKLDEAAKPKALDLVDFRAPEDTPARPAPPFIYALEGDTLKLCGAGDAGQPRPTEFKTSGSGRTRTVLMELTRKRPAK
jgi:uncharacterized protein (TIGR03067 family)